MCTFSSQITVYFFLKATHNHVTQRMVTLKWVVRKGDSCKVQLFRSVLFQPVFLFFNFWRFFFMKKLLLASLAVLAVSAQAAALSGIPFSVTATVTPACVAGVAPVSPAVAFGAYPAFSASAVLSTSGFTATVDCTRFIAAPPTAAFDVGTNKLATGEGIVAGLNYSLTATAAAVVPGAEPTATTGAHNGTADKYGFTVSGSLPSGQAGSTAAPVSHSRSLIISF
jgi:spore coat protein U-like protein